MRRNVLQPHNIVQALMAIVVAVTLAIVCASCGSQQQATPQPNRPQPKKPNVVATIDTWASLAKEIGSSDVHVDTILKGSKADTQLVQLNNAQTKTLQAAQLVIANGAGYDDWASKFIAKKTEVVQASAVIGAVEGDNPYLWFSKDARLAMAQAITEAFTRLVPSKKQVFNRRLETIKDREKALATYIETFKKDHSKLTVAATSPILSYLLSDLQIVNATPKNYQQDASSPESKDSNNQDATQDSENNSNDNKTNEDVPGFNDFRKLLEDRKIDVIIHNSQRGNDITNTLSGLAGRSYINSVWVSELMPEYTTSLDQWIRKICDDLDQAATATHAMDKTLEKTDNETKTTKPIETKPHVVAPSKPRSNAGQQDPGK